MSEGLSGDPQSGDSPDGGPTPPIGCGRKSNSAKVMGCLWGAGGHLRPLFRGAEYEGLEMGRALVRCISRKLKKKSETIVYS